MQKNSQNRKFEKFPKFDQKSIFSKYFRLSRPKLTYIISKFILYLLFPKLHHCYLLWRDHPYHSIVLCNKSIVQNSFWKVFLLNYLWHFWKWIFPSIPLSSIPRTPSRRSPPTPAVQGFSTMSQAFGIPKAQLAAESWVEYSRIWFEICRVLKY